MDKDMKMDEGNLDPRLVAAVRKIESHVEGVTGIRPTPGELSRAMGKFFVLKEILEFIQLERGKGA